MKSYVKAKLELEFAKSRIRFLRSMSGRVDFKQDTIFSEEKINKEISDLEVEVTELTSHIKELKEIWAKYEGKKNDLEAIVFEQHFIKGRKPKNVARYAHCHVRTVQKKIEKIERMVTK